MRLMLFPVLSIDMWWCLRRTINSRFQPEHQFSFVPPSMQWNAVLFLCERAHWQGRAFSFSCIQYRSAAVSLTVRRCFLANFRRGTCCIFYPRFEIFSSAGLSFSIPLRRHRAQLVGYFDVPLDCLCSFTKQVFAQLDLLRYCRRVWMAPCGSH